MTEALFPDMIQKAPERKKSTRGGRGGPDAAAPTRNEVPEISLYPHQEKLVQEARAEMARLALGPANQRRMVLQAATGLGKCLAVGTPVLMADGTIKAVELVRNGDQVMGPDGLPRSVSGTTRGFGPLYRVTPTKGDPYVVNDAHIISTRKTPGSSGLVLADGTRVHKNADVVNVNVEVLAGSSKYARHVLKGWRSDAVESFGREDPGPDAVPAYIVGVYLGDGSLARPGGRFTPEVSKPQCEATDEWAAYVRSRGLEVSVYDPDRCPRWVASSGRGSRVNVVAEELRALGIHEARFIPDAYKYGSAEVRREVLAGLIDTDGHISGPGGAEITSKHERLANDILFVARSLGLSAYASLEVKGIKSSGFTGEYWRVRLSGDLDDLPMRDKVAAPRLQKKRHRVHGITIEPAGEGEWAGFEVSGDNLFLLGDFTVTHNTRISGFIVASALSKGNRSLFVVAGRTLVQQAARSFRELGLRAGVIMAGIPYDKGAAIQVASVDTIMSRAEDLDWFNPTLVIVDECHEAFSDRFHKVRELWPEAFELGLTATAARTNGKPFGEVYRSILKAPGYDWLIEHGYLVQPKFYSVKEVDSQLLKRSSSGEFTERSNEAAYDKVVLVGGVVKHWKSHAQGRPTVVFAASVAHSQKICEQFNEAGIPAAHVDANTPDEERQELYRQLSDGELLVICNYGVLGRGWDVTAVSCAIIAREYRSVVNWIQAVGRALRKHEGKTDAIIIDLGENYYRHGDFVIDPVEWSLDGDEAIRKEREEQLKERKKSEAVCPRCHLIFAGPKCPGCGFVPPPPPPKSAEQVERDATLELMQSTPNERAKKATMGEKRRVYEELLGLCHQRGWKPGRAYYLYHEFYGIFPAGKVTKGSRWVRPSMRVLEWYKKTDAARKKAFAARRDKAEAARKPAGRWTGELDF